MPSFSVLPGPEVFFCTPSIPALVSQPKIRFAILCGANLKDQHMKKIRLALALAGIVLVPQITRAKYTTTITENFSTDPLKNGWHVVGDTNLFRWDSTNRLLDVTWDSTQTNSYFYYPLAQYLTRHDDFSIEFDLNLTDIASGVETNKTGPLELGFGFHQQAGATSTNFMRGSFGSAPNIAEFDYYAAGYYNFGGVIYPSVPTTTPAFISGTDSFDYAPTDLSVYDNELPTNQTVHVRMAYTASNQTAVVFLASNGVPLGQLPGLVLNTNNGFSDADDFQVDAFSISSYSSFGDAYDSILAHGSVANIVVTLPPPVQNISGAFTNGNWQVRFASRINWLYTLERTTDFLSWSDVSAPAAGNGANLVLQDAAAPADRACYRVRANRP
jgi:hypothetical protein